MGEKPKLPIETQLMDKMSTLLDNRFRVPGTNFRFGIDAIIGILPGFGDIVSYAMSSALILGMVRQGASTVLILKMIWNIVLDTVVGSIPLLGDLFDAWYKANRRNYLLFKKYHESNDSPKSLWSSLFIVMALLILLLLALLYVIFIWIPTKLWNSPLP